jgi:hypothetical protein
VDSCAGAVGSRAAAFGPTDPGRRRWLGGRLGWAAGHVSRSVRGWSLTARDRHSARQIAPVGGRHDEDRAWPDQSCEQTQERPRDAVGNRCMRSNGHSHTPAVGAGRSGSARVGEPSIAPPTRRRPFGQARWQAPRERRQGVGNPKQKRLSVARSEREAPLVRGRPIPARREQHEERGRSHRRPQVVVDRASSEAAHGRHDDERPLPALLPERLPGSSSRRLASPAPRATYFVSSRPPVHHRVPEHPPCRPRANDQGQARGQPCRPHERMGQSDAPSARSAMPGVRALEPRADGGGRAAGGPPASRSSSRTRGVRTRGRSTGMSCRRSGRSRWPLLTPTCSTRSMPSCGTAVTIATASGTCGSPDSVGARVQRALPAEYLRGAPGIDDPADPISS